jgi:hypothetical protein
MKSSPSQTEELPEEVKAPAPPLVPNFDPLEGFAKWFAEQTGPIPLGHMNGVRRIGAFTGLTLVRSGQFQAQLWICDPQSEIPDHSHPKIDTIQIYVSGDLQLRLNGKNVMEEPVLEFPEGRCSHNGRWIRVRPNDTHGATIGPRGAAFINVQQWSGEPTSAELDWDGPALSEDHRALLDATAAK